MSLQILYFASLREAVGQSSESLDLPEGLSSVGGLRRHLAERGGHWAEAFGQGRLLASVNQQMAEDDHPVADGDEIAFFPPVTGG